MNTSPQFIQNATTAEQHASNCQFQLDNVLGWLSASAKGDAGALLAARVKAECLRDSALLLVLCLEEREEGERNQQAKTNGAHGGSATCDRTRPTTATNPPASMGGELEKGY